MSGDSGGNESSGADGAGGAGGGHMSKGAEQRFVAGVRLWAEGGVNGMLGSSPASMQAELETLDSFRKRVDKLLDDLPGTEADPLRLGEDRIPAHAIGADFAEAATLHNTYQEIHDQLVTLSRLLSAQIGALSTAVSGARHGYHGVELDAQRSMWNVQRNLEHHYNPKLDPHPENRDHQGADHGADQTAQHGDGGEEQQAQHETKHDAKHETEHQGKRGSGM